MGMACVMARGRRVGHTEGAAGRRDSYTERVTSLPLLHLPGLGLARPPRRCLHQPGVPHPAPPYSNTVTWTQPRTEVFGGWPPPRPGREPCKDGSRDFFTPVSQNRS